MRSIDAAARRLQRRLMLAATLLFASTMAQAGPQVTVGTVPAVTDTSPEAIPVTMSDFEAAEKVFAIVSVSAGGGSLTLVGGDQGGKLTQLFGYDSFENRLSIGFSGTPADVADALDSQLVWNAPMHADPVEVTVSVSQYAEGTYYNPANGHYYLPIAATGTNWTEAKVAAATQSLFGMTGYLATVTSKQENDFVSNYTTLDNLWIGASDEFSQINTACEGPNTPIRPRPKATGTG